MRSARWTATESSSRSNHFGLISSIVVRASAYPARGLRYAVQNLGRSRGLLRETSRGVTALYFQRGSRSTITG